MDEDSKPRRLLIKISGEALRADSSAPFSSRFLVDLAHSLKEIQQSGVQLSVVIGGGNFFRGNMAHEVGLSQVEADQMGMLATVMNGIALENAFLRMGLKAVHISAYAIKGVVEPFAPAYCRQLLEQGKILIFSAGLGRPFFTTDTAAVSRSIEIGAQLLVKGTKVDGVYNADPLKDQGARRFSRLSYDDVILNRLMIMDQTAFTLAKENRLPIKVVDISEPKKLKTSIENPEIGTIIS